MKEKKIQIHKIWWKSHFINPNRESTHFSSNSHRSISYTYTTHTYTSADVVTLYYRYLAAMNQLIIKGSGVSTPVTESPPLPLPLSIANSHGREISHYRYTLHYRAPFLFPNSIEIQGNRVAGPNNTRRLNRVTDGYKSSDFDIVAHPKATKFCALYIKNTMQPFTRFWYEC